MTPKSQLTIQNYAFISYSHKDVKWAKWLQKKLEWYRLPTEAHNELTDSRYLRPVFRDRDTLTSGVLNDELLSHLESSKYLVVLCSPNSAQSEWVSDEIKAFMEMGRLDKIVPFIIYGTPQDYRQADIKQPLMGECFPFALRQWNKDHPDKNLLGIAVSDDGKTNRQKAFIRLVAYLLGIGFDTLWQRHRRYIRRLITSLAFLAVTVFALAYWFMIPVKVSITIEDDYSKLPGMEQGILYFDGCEYSLSHPDTTIETNALPGYYRLRIIPVSFHSDRFYIDIEEPLRIGMGISQHFTLQLQRDSTFAVFAGAVYDGGFEDFVSHPIEGASITVGQYSTYTDPNGRFRVDFPLNEQEESKPICISKPGYHSFLRNDESPNRDLTYLIYHE